MAGDPVKRFWLRYLAVDDVERHRMIRELVERYIYPCTEVSDRETVIHCMTTMIKSYIDDLAAVLRETLHHWVTSVAP